MANIEYIQGIKVDDKIFQETDVVYVIFTDGDMLTGDIAEIAESYLTINNVWVDGPITIRFSDVKSIAKVI